MGLQRRSKVSAEFSMSSLTDIIFLLLIFFMLTSTLVNIRPFELPKSDSKTVAPTSVIVSITNNGQHEVDEQEVPRQALQQAINRALRNAETGAKKEFTVTIVAEVGTPFDYVVNVMQIAARLGVKAIIATEPREG